MLLLTVGKRAGTGYHLLLLLLLLLPLLLYFCP
jgi:hypothetical protein